MKFQTALYGKLFGKSPSFEQVKSSLIDKWAGIGETFISDLPNGFLLIRCSSEKVMERLLLEGPWTVNGMILQLSPWKPFFEPSFAKLSTAAIWVQFHNLPVEYWDGDTLETIANNFGTLIKIDEFTTTLVRSKYARVCIEVDLSKPLCRGFWIGDDFHRVFVVVMYERLPMFCYNCGLIGHGSSSCTKVMPTGAGGPPMPDCRVRSQVEGSNQVSESMDHVMNSSETPNVMTSVPPVPESHYGPWLLVSRRRGGSRGRGGGPRASHVTLRNAVVQEQGNLLSRGEVSRNIRGGKNSVSRGRASVPYVPHSIPRHDASLISPTDPLENFPTVDPCLEMNPLLLENSHSDIATIPAIVSTPLSKLGDYPPSESPNQIIPFCSSREASSSGLSNPNPPPLLDRSDAKMSRPPRSKSPPPRLRSSLSLDPSSCIPADTSHALIVERVSSVLDCGNMEEDSEDEDDPSSEEDEGMLDDDEGPDDSMTLVQF